MENPLIFLYENERGGSLAFRRDSELWITSVTGLSGVEAGITEAQGAGQVGATAMAASIQPKTLTLNGLLWSSAARRTLLAAVLPGVAARLTMLDGGSRYYLEGIPSKSPEVENSPGPQKFQCSFRCSYPCWRGEEAAAGLAGLTALFSFPRSLAGSWYVSRYSTNAFATVENAGNMPSDLTVRFAARARVTNPQLYHLESGGYLRLNTVLDAGETAEISTVYGRKGATLTRAGGETENIFRLLDIGSDLSLQALPGLNTYRCSADEGQAGLDVTILAPKGVWAGV